MLSVQSIFYASAELYNVRDGRLCGVTLSTVRTLKELVFSLSPLLLFVHNTGPQCCVEIGAEWLGLAVLTWYIQLQT